MSLAMSVCIIGNFVRENEGDREKIIVLEKNSMLSALIIIICFLER